MKQAVAGVMARILAQYPTATFSVMVDGNKLPVSSRISSIISNYAWRDKGDGKHACISGASVIAKVTRDRDMALSQRVS
ncbi:MAG: hypothetical protein U1E91_04690 [Moraxella sp.]